MSTTVLGLSADHLSHSWSTTHDPRRSRRTSSGLTSVRRWRTSTRRSSSTSPRTPTTSATTSAGPRWQDVEALMTGPEPRPDWVVTSSGAIDTELGILKTGKEADVFLLERADPHRPDGAVVMAAKRYRDTDHRTFHRAATYTEGRSHEAVPRQPRPQAQVARGASRSRPASGRSRSGTRCAAAGSSASRSPTRCRSTAPRSSWSGSPHDGETAPRLAQARPERVAARALLRAAARTPWRRWSRRGIVARRPVAVQHPGRRRPAGDHRPAADRRPRRQPARHGLPAARLRQHVPAGSARGGSTSTSTTCSGS